MKLTATRPRILVTNDDGIDSKGINKLIETLCKLGDVIVFAPASQRSGTSSAITPGGVGFRLISQEEGLTIYSCDGTPVDCVKIALNIVLDKKPDLLVSGINHGHNAAVSVIYSGTMGAAAEGAVFKIPSIGFSLDDHLPDADFAATQKVVSFVCKKVLKESLPPGVYLNVNIPATTNVKGIMICSQAKGKWVNEFAERKDENEGRRYCFSGEFSSEDSQLPTNDIAWLRKGYATVVPCKIDVTDYSMLSRMTSWETSSFLDE